MRIIIDGYNMIRQSATLRHHEKYSLEEGRRALLQSLAAYRRRKGHEMTVVFDGWKSGSPDEERDREGGIEIVYSRLGELADEVIKRMVEKSGKDVLVVTSDRGIGDFVTRRGGTVLSSPVFEERIRKADQDLPSSDFPKDDEDGNERQPGKKKGPSRRPSRKEKNIITALRKL